MVVMETTHTYFQTPDHLSCERCVMNTLIQHEANER